MIDEMITIEACGKALDQIADKDYDGAIETISKLRADNQQKVDEFEKWAEEESKKQQNINDEAFAVLREAVWRVLELWYFDVQLLGGLVLNMGKTRNINIKQTT